jgi:hypothetical protein
MSQLPSGPTKVTKVTVTTADGKTHTFEGADGGHARVDADKTMAGKVKRRVLTVVLPIEVNP